jgi:hypothetical protein
LPTGFFLGLLFRLEFFQGLAVASFFLQSFKNKQIKEIIYKKKSSGFSFLDLGSGLLID